MKKIFIITLFLCLDLFLSAQDNRQSKIDSIERIVTKYFNEKNDGALYELAGKSFRAQLPDSVFRKICTQHLFPLGEIKETTFISYSNGVSSFKTKFSSAILELLLRLDSSDKIEVLQFKPWVDEHAKKTEKVPSTNHLINLLDRKVDSLVQPYMSRQETTGLSIGVLINGKTFFYAYGETKKGNKQIPDEHSIFEIGSITKTFTAILLADAVLEGKVGLEDPLSKYLPDSISDLEFGDSPITLKTLSNHSSGIPSLPSNFAPADMNNPYKDYEREKLFGFYAHFKPMRVPGEEYEYSNLAVGTLGVVLERVYKKNYEALLIEKICDPLGMNDTRQFIRKNDSVRFVKGYNENGYYNGPWDFKAIAGAGAIRSTLSDMLRYANANLGMAPAQLRKAIQLTHVVTFDKGVKVGLAWHVIKPGQDDILFHNGGTGGYRSYLAINQEKHFAVVILSNTAISTEDIGNSLMKWLETNESNRAF
jgi:CubicO group peptidase (beta-lactamase class C family)